MDPEDRQQKRRNALLRAGFELFGTRGYRATSVRMICGHAGLTERYFYESFPNREALLLEVYAELEEELEQRLAQVIEREGVAEDRRLEDAIAGFFRYIHEDKRRGRIMFLEIVGVSNQVDRSYQSVVREQAATIGHPNLGLFGTGSTPDERDRRVLGTGLVGALTQIATQWVLEDFETPEDIVISNALTICRGVARYIAGRD